MTNLLLILALSLVSQAPAHSAGSACPVGVPDDLSVECRQEILAAIKQEKVSLAMRATVEKSLNLRDCREGSPERLSWAYVPAGAVGPQLRVATFIGCEGDGYSGYWLGGSYHLSETSPDFEFLNLGVETFE